MKKTEHKDPMALDMLAARDDRARIYFDYGRNESIALKKGGKFLAAKRAEHMKRVIDVLAECERWDRIDTTAYRGPQFTIKHPRRKV